MSNLQREAQIIEYYQEGYSLKNVAILMGFPLSWIKKILIKNGIPRRQRVLELIPDQIVSCLRCGTPFLRKGRINGRRNKRIGFCSRFCANSRNHSKETRLKISKGIKAYIEKHGPSSEETRLRISEGVRAHIKKYGPLNHYGFLNNSRFTSKGEVEVREYFQSKYPSDGWTFGGGLKVEDKRISRDLYSKSLKVCIEYDGIWHFKDIHGQLADKQLKDALLELWCKENGYRLIRIEDRLFKADKTFWLKRLEDEVYQNNTPLVKFYNPLPLRVAHHA